MEQLELMVHLVNSYVLSRPERPYRRVGTGRRPKSSLTTGVAVRTTLGKVCLDVKVSPLAPVPNIAEAIQWQREKKTPPPRKVWKDEEIMTVEPQWQQDRFREVEPLERMELLERLESPVGRKRS